MKSSFYLKAIKSIYENKSNNGTLSAGSHKGLKICVINVCLKVTGKSQIELINNFIQHQE